MKSLFLLSMLSLVPCRGAELPESNVFDRLVSEAKRPEDEEGRNFYFKRAKLELEGWANGVAGQWSEKHSFSTLTEVPCSIKLDYFLSNTPSLITGTYWKGFQLSMSAGSFNTWWLLNTTSSQTLKVPAQETLPNPLREGFELRVSERIYGGRVYRTWSTVDRVYHFESRYRGQVTHHWLLLDETLAQPLAYSFAQAGDPEHVTCETQAYRTRLAQAKLPNDGPSKVVSVWTERGKYCLDEATDRDRFYAFPCHGRENQTFRYDPRSGRIESKHSGRCLTVLDEGARWGKDRMYRTALKPCGSGTPGAQTFSADRTGRGFELRDGWRRYCLNLHHGDGAKFGEVGYEVVAFPCRPADHQRWYFEKAN